MRPSTPEPHLRDGPSSASCCGASILSPPGHWGPCPQHPLLSHRPELQEQEMEICCVSPALRSEGEEFKPTGRLSVFPSLTCRRGRGPAHRQAAVEVADAALGLWDSVQPASPSPRAACARPAAGSGCADWTGTGQRGVQQELRNRTKQSAGICLWVSRQRHCAFCPNPHAWSTCGNAPLRKAWQPGGAPCGLHSGPLPPCWW